MTVAGNLAEKVQLKAEEQHVSPMHYGCVEIDEHFTIKRSHDRTFSLIMGESAVTGKNLLRLLKARVSKNDFQRVGGKILNTVRERISYKDTAEKNPLNCFQISLSSRGASPVTRYIRIELTKSVSFYRDGRWIAVVHDISKAVRDIQKKQVSQRHPTSSAKHTSVEHDILNLISIDRSLVDGFLSDAVSVIKDIALHLSNPKHARQTLPDIACLIHQIKGDAAALNFRTIAKCAHDFENILEKINRAPKQFDVYFRQLTAAILPIVNAIKQLRAIYTKLIEGGWITKKKENQHNTMPRKLELLIQQLSQDNHKRALLVNDGYHDKNLPKAYRKTIDTVVTQLARNAIAHGIEDKETRIHCSKTPYGCIHIGVSKTNTSLMITFRDDGRGINAVRIKAAAMVSGKFNREKVQSWNKNQILNALFTSGFSTADNVSQTAGRGVGLDIIKKNVEHLGGNIGIRSIQGQFTEFVLSFPIK